MSGNSETSPTDEVAHDDAWETDLLTPEGADAAERPGGIRRRLAALPALVSRNRALWITAAVAVVALVAGLLAGRYLIAPAEAAGAEPPAAGLVTVPVEFGELSNDVTIRGEFGYVDPVEVDVDTSAFSGPAVVTGQVPAVGAELAALGVALEVAGRPVIVLPGELPAYRTLRFGVSGPDVVQFKEAMRAVGIDAGDPSSNVFDETAARAVTTLYAQAGYPPPVLEGDAGDAVRAAEENVRAAEQSVRAAQNDLAQAQSGPSAVEIREADNAVASARRELDAARATDPADAVLIGNLQDALALAELRRQSLDVPQDTSSQRAAVDAANAALAQAREALQQTTQDALPFLPSGEVLYLTELPRRVDAVSVERGSVVDNPAMTVSGATVALTGSAAEADAALLEVGAAASFLLLDDTPHPAVVTALTSPADGETRWTVTLEPAPLTPEELLQLQGTNVRVSIPVGSTTGEVLFVPLAALSAGPGGESRVEVVVGDPRDGARAETRLVVVETGLAATGAVEVTPVDGALDEGDLVVVGR